MRGHTTIEEEAVKVIASSLRKGNIVDLDEIARREPGAQRALDPAARHEQGTPVGVHVGRPPR